MGESAGHVPGKGVSEQVDSWVAEIRDYLLGRLSAKARIQDIPPAPAATLTHPPIRRWWTFEGKRYSSLGGTLASSWDTVLARAQRLEQTFNPRLRLTDRADGTVDWARTLARGPLRLQSEFVVRSSGIGLDENEHAALHGWATWISNEWFEYTSANGVGDRLNWRTFQVGSENVISANRLRRWAHTARRSRWAFLRDVVAESLRPVIEPSELDRIPLPADPPTLFELLCLVRIARELAPVPRDLRWLNHEISANILHLDGVRVFYQQSLPKDAVLATSEYRGSLASAVDIFGVRAPQTIDIAFDFDRTRAGFDGLIVEAKSGGQQYGAAVPQLRVYRAARPRPPLSRYIVWGVVEKPDGPETTSEQVRRALSVGRPIEDVWIFSGADAIATVLHTVFNTTKLSGGHNGNYSLVNNTATRMALGHATVTP
jgi:hypothetical protein